MPKKLLICSACGNDDIEFRMWTDEHGKVTNDCEETTCFCNVCCEEHRFISKETTDE